MLFLCNLNHPESSHQGGSPSGIYRQYAPWWDWLRCGRGDPAAGFIKARGVDSDIMDLSQAWQQTPLRIVGRHCRPLCREWA